MNEPFDGKKLFTVEIEQTIVVLAANETEAEEIAKDTAGCGGDLDWNDAMYSSYESGRCLPADWVKAIPFGLENMKDQTCGQIRDALEEYERTRPPTKAELEALGQVPLIPV